MVPIAALVAVGIVALTGEGVAQPVSRWSDGWSVIADGARGRLLVIDLKSGRVMQRIPVEASTGTALSVQEVASYAIVRVPGPRGSTLSSIRLADLEVTGSRQLPPDATTVLDGDRLWQVDLEEGEAQAIDPDDLDPVGRPVRIGERRHRVLPGVASVGGRVAAISAGPNPMLEIADGDSDDRRSVRLAPGSTAAIAAGDSELWLAEPGRGTVTAITGSGDDRVTRIALPEAVATMFATDGRLFFPSADSGIVEVLDPVAGTITSTSTNLDWPGSAVRWDQVATTDGTLVLNQSTGDHAALLGPSGVVDVAKADDSATSDPVTVPSTSAPPTTLPPSPTSTRPPTTTTPTRVNGKTTTRSTTPGSTTPGSTTPGSTTPGSTTPGSSTPGSTTPGATSTTTPFDPDNPTPLSTVPVTSPVSTSPSTTPTTQPGPTLVGATSPLGLVAGNDFSCAVTPSGGAGCWGSNNSGQLGDGSQIDSSRPVTVSGLSDIAGLARGVGSYHMCAVLGGAQAVCWGNNWDGQLGTTTATTWSTTPVVVEGLHGGVRDLTVGHGHTCALLVTGRVDCWGLNVHGQLGSGTRTQTSSTVAVTGLQGVASVVAGLEYTCALQVVGAVQCWGINDVGQLGDGTTTDSAIPVPVQGLQHGVLAISAGTFSTCALLATGRVTCWGLLDWENEVISLTPTVATGVSGARQLSTGRFSTCTIGDDRLVRCWGDNDDGQLGDGGFERSASPVIVAGLGPADALSAGSRQVCARRTDGEIRCWGRNEFGQVGIGSADPAAVPTPTAVASFP